MAFSRLSGPRLVSETPTELHRDTAGTVLMTQLVLVNSGGDQTVTIWIGSADRGNELYQQKIRGRQTTIVDLSVTLGAEEGIIAQCELEDSVTITVNCST